MLKEILEILGIKKIEDLSWEDRLYYQQLEAITNIKDVTIEDLKLFIEGQIAVLEDQLFQPGNPLEKDSFLKAQLRNFKMLLGFIVKPEKSREAAKQQIELLKKRVSEKK